MISHFHFFLSLRQVKLDQQEIEEREITDYEQITFKDLDETAIVGEWVTYLEEFAKAMMKGDGDLISYSAAIQYMSSFKCTMVDKYCTTGVPQQFEKTTWTRMLAKIRCKKYEYSRIHCKRMLDLKTAAASEDKED